MNFLDKNIFDQIFNNFPCGVFLKDKNCNYLKVNNYYLNNLNFNHENAVLGKNILQVSGPWTFDEAHELYVIDKDTIEREKGNLGVISTLTSESCKTVIVNKTPLRDLTGQIVGLVGMYVDASNIQLMDFASNFLKSFTLEEKINRLYDFDKFTTFLNKDFPKGICVEVKNRYVRLSVQELRCLFLLFQGKTMKSATNDIDIVYKTFQEYVANARKKTGLNTKEGLIKLFQDQVLKWFM